MPDVRGGEYFGPGRLMELRGHPVRVSSTKRSRDEADAARLWSVSERLTGVTYPWPGPAGDEASHDPDTEVPADL
jgi:hypothetical protein